MYRGQLNPISRLNIQTVMTTQGPSTFPRKESRRANRGGILAILLTMASLPVFAAEKPSLMALTGPYPLAQVLFDWTDTSRGEPGTPDALDHRTIPVQIWYPTSKKDPTDRAPYRPRVESFREAWGDESVDFYQSVATSWSRGGPAHGKKPFPVILFSHGWSARSSSHGTFLGNLASQGYVVVGINHPFLGKVAMANGGLTEPNDSQFENQAEANAFYARDVSFVLDRLETLEQADLAPAMDLDRVAACGHSSGFPAVSGAAVNDPRIRALVSFDSGVQRIVRDRGLDVPILLVRADQESYTALFFRDEETHPKGTIDDVDFFRVHRAALFDLNIDSTTHNSIYDEYLFAETGLEAKTSLRNHRLVADHVAAFLEQELGNGSSDTLEKRAGESTFVELRKIPAPR